MKSSRKEVYEAIDTEREYQDTNTRDPQKPNMNPEFNMGQGILCMEEILLEARKFWYLDSPENNYLHVTPYLRKLAAVVVQMGEKYGMPKRKKPLYSEE